MKRADKESIAARIEEKIYAFMLGETDSDDFKKSIGNLSSDRDTALALISLIDSFDLPELYEALFHSKFLSCEERHTVQVRAERIFDLETLRLLKE